MVISNISKIKIYHRDDCPYVNKIRSENRYFVSASEAKRRGYTPCSWCGGLHGVYLKTQEFPNMFGEKERRYLQFDYDKKKRSLLIRSNIGLWRVAENITDHKLLLYHRKLEEGERKLSTAKLRKRPYHRQGDMNPTDNLASIVTYIYQHDKAKTMANGDYRKLPKKTKRQKKYYKQAKKKDYFNYMRKMDELFKQIEDERRS